MPLKEWSGRGPGCPVPYPVRAPLGRRHYIDPTFGCTAVLTGCGQPVRLNEVLGKLATLIGVEVRAVHEPARAGTSDARLLMLLPPSRRSELRRMCHWRT